jgi:hypothetical protein
MKFKRIIAVLTLIVAVAALALPAVGRRAYASFSTSATTGPAPSGSLARAGSALAVARPAATLSLAQSSGGSLDPKTVASLAIKRLPEGVNVQEVIRDVFKTHGTGPREGLNSGQPRILETDSALSAAFLTAIGGRNTQFSEITLIADWDGREDCTADREAKVDDFSFVEPDIDFTLTRTAISEHTVANGFNENVYYYGDSIGDLWIGTDADSDGLVESVLQVFIPSLVNTGAAGGVTLLNPQPGDCTDDQITVTGIAVNPVADLGDFGLCGEIGEVVYVSTLDTEGCANNGNNEPFRTRIFAFGFQDTGAGVGPVGAIQIVRDTLSNIAGVAVDDDGSIYFQLMDLIQRSGGAIFKISEAPRAICATAGRINRVITNGASTIDGLTLGTTALSTPNINITNYSGNSTLFGNIASITAGPNNTLYAAVSAAAPTGTPPSGTQGLFPAPPQFAAGTPSMIISFADCRGQLDTCTRPDPSFPGVIPIADGFADPSLGTGPVTAGVNNYRLFALGLGPDIRAGGVVPDTPASLLKIDMQIDFTIYSGIAVTEEGAVYVISGGTPGGEGNNPSPGLGEVLCFEDTCRKDRRADFIDFRGNSLPIPPVNGGNVGDGDSDRFDHLFYQAPLDQSSFTPTGLAGFARGFLRYTNRLAPNAISPGVTLGQTGGPAVQGDDDTSGPIIFESLDPGHQVAGGDDQTSDSGGDDTDGLGSPALGGPLDGGFEFVFGGPVASCIWNGFFLNSNGNITFGGGDADNIPVIGGFRMGLPKIAPAWADLDPDARAINPGAFPVQALGFSGINAFKVRWINVPEFGSEDCTGPSAGGSNTFSITLYDDGTGPDENASQPVVEGPTDLRFTTEQTTSQVIGCPPKREGSGNIRFEYGRMLLIGSSSQPVIAGYSIGGGSPLNPPGLCELNLSTAALAADSAPFAVIQGQTASIAPCLLGEGTEPQMFELFNEGINPAVNGDGTIRVAIPDFDLRGEGNDPAACTPANQPDVNRGVVSFYGIGCSPPADPICFSIIPGPFATTPTTTGLVNALCEVPLTMVGCGFFPNEVTTVCQSGIGGPPRPGKTVSTALSLACDTNGDGTPEATIPLVNVAPLSENAVAGTLPVLANFPGTAFPLACCGGMGTLTATTTFSAGDNNIFGPFTRTTQCSIDLGLRAPVVISVSASSGDCGVLQNLNITGACFVSPAGPITAVFAVEILPNGTLNPANTIQAESFVVINNNLIDAHFRFGAINAGKRFLIFVTGPGGTSRNLTALPPGAPAGCVLGNEQGIQASFTCGQTVANRDTIGVFRDPVTKFYLRNSNTSGFADIIVVYGSVGDQPLAGDFNGDNVDTLGTFRQGVFFLRNSNSTGFADVVIGFGSPGDIAVMGDWNGDGVDTIGVYRNGTFFLRNSNTTGVADMTFTLGIPGDIPIAGDWNGDGIDTVGVFRPSTGAVFLKNQNTTGFADILLTFGLPGDRPVAGDWNGDGIDTIGVYRGGTFFLRNSNTDGFADLVFTFGFPGDQPIAGDWDGLF